MHQSHILVRQHLALGSVSITDGNTTAFLSSVLECKQAIINTGGNVIAIKIVHTKNTTFFLDMLITALRSFCHLSLNQFLAHLVFPFAV